jgi:hypothetical protein
MKENLEREVWTSYFAEFNKRNRGRPTWLQILGEGGAQSEAEGIPLDAVTFDDKVADGPEIQIMLGGAGELKSGHLTHLIPKVERIMTHLGADGREEAMEFIDQGGQATLLTFKERALLAAHS